MHIAFLSFDFYPQIGGVQTFLYEIGRRLGEQHRVTAVTPVPGPCPPGVPLHKLPPTSAAGHAGHALNYWRTLRRLRPDRVIVGHAHPQLLLAAALYGRYAALAHGNDFLAAQRQWHRPLFNHLLHRATPLITITQANADRLQSLRCCTVGIRQRAVVVYPGTDPAIFRPTAGAAPPFPPVLLTVSRLVSRKGIDTVIQALPSLRRQFPDLRYHVVGTGPDEARLRTLAQQEGVETAVHFYGRLPQAELPAAYQQAHLFVMPAREETAVASIEGFGIVYLEASASGLPVIVGQSGGAMEAIRPGHTGLAVPPNDPTALAHTLATLLHDHDLRQRLGQNGRHWVETEMNWDQSTSQLLQAI